MQRVLTSAGVGLGETVAVVLGRMVQLLTINKNDQQPKAA